MITKKLLISLICIIILFISTFKISVAAPNADPYLYDVHPGWVEVVCFDCGFTNPVDTHGYITFHVVGETFEQIIWMQYGGKVCTLPPTCYDYWYAQWYPWPAQYVFEYGEITGAPSYKIIQGLPATINIFGTWFPTIFQGAI